MSFDVPFRTIFPIRIPVLRKAIPAYHTDYLIICIDFDSEMALFSCQSSDIKAYYSSMTSSSGDYLTPDSGNDILTYDSNKYTCYKAANHQNRKIIQDATCLNNIYRHKHLPYIVAYAPAY